MKLTTEQLVIKDSIRDFFANEFGDEYLFTKLKSAVFDPQIWNKLTSFGFQDAFLQENAADSWGILELNIIATEIGRHLIAEPLLSDLIVRRYILSLVQKQSKIQDAPYLFFVKNRDDLNSRNGNQVLIDLIDLNSTGQIVLLLSSESAAEIVLINQELVQVELKTEGADLIIPKGSISFDLNLCQSVPISIEIAKELKAIYQLVIAAQLSGMVEKVFEMTLDYCNLRKQFDVPISSFQVTQHKLADLYLVVESLRALVNFTANAERLNKQQFFFSSLAAMVYANEQAIPLIEKAIQLHGGIGFTWEHKLHLYLRRALILKYFSSQCKEELSSNVLF